jgi:hypothetical protein
MRQYEEAIALYHNKLSINTAPVYFGFHNDFLCSIKNFFLDLNKLNELLLRINGSE